MERGDTVYTVDAKTNSVDAWTYHGSIFAPGEELAYLECKRGHTIMPVGHIFTDKAKAEAVADIFKGN